MGFFGKLFNKRKTPSQPANRRTTHLAFVLLPDATHPDDDAIRQAFAHYAPSGETMMERADDSDGDDANRDTYAFAYSLTSGEGGILGLMDVPVPDGEAEDAAQFSMGAIGKTGDLQPHRAHMLVMMSGSETTPAAVELSRFTSVLAAVVHATDAVGVYWGEAGATHTAKFFLDVAQDKGVVPRIMLWSGVSVARERDGRASLLSLGMSQLNLFDLLLVTSPASTGAAFETMFDLLSYVANRGEPIGEGETIGRTAEEKLPVTYIESPIDPKKKVWRVELL